MFTQTRHRVQCKQDTVYDVEGALSSIVERGVAVRSEG